MFSDTGWMRGFTNSYSLGARNIRHCGSQKQKCYEERFNCTPLCTGSVLSCGEYLEAAGVINAIKAGIAVESIRRQLANTSIELKECGRTVKKDKIQYKQPSTLK